MPHARMLGCVTALVMTAAAAGCSSSGPKVLPPPLVTTTTTTPAQPPTPAEIAKNRAFLMHAGAKLVQFVTVTKPLVGPINPSSFTCFDLDRNKLPKLGRPSALLALAAKVPDPHLAFLFDRDMRTKLLLLDACSRSNPDLAQGPMDFTRTQTATLVQRLAEYKITP